MTSSGPSQQQPDNQQPKDGRLKRLRRRLSQFLWTISSLKQYREIRQDSEKKIRVKLNKREFEKKIVSNSEKLDNERKLYDLITTFEDIYVKEAKEDLDKSAKKAKEDLKEMRKKHKETLEEQTTKSIRQQLYNLKTHKSMEGQLQKLQAFIIIFPIILAAFSIIFRDRIQDIMEIDVLREKIEHLQEDIKSSQPNGLSAGSSVCQPGDETCCSSDDGFFSC